jgi:type I restriction enzyme M protein
MPRIVKQERPEQLTLASLPAAMPRGRGRAAQPVTTAQRLGSVVKAARDIMRKDKGLSGDLDRLPMLTWIMFLKFFDDMEQMREEEAVLAGEPFRPAIAPPYRWRDWAARPDGVTGDALIAFVNNERAVRPDGSEGPGLFAYLRSLQGADGGDRRDVIATVFQGIVNRMINGYLLRDVINKVDEIHFASSEEIHILGNLYESMLKEMRDAAGDAGEFYTPRAVVRLMVELVDPRLGEVVLDPACGTAGFLVEAHRHLERQCRTVQDRETLQRRSLRGGEPKPLPYLLAQMNLVLHGLETPRIDPGNSLAIKVTEIGDRDRVDVILTNPPFGGEEEAGILGNFPSDRQTRETALLFLQLIMRRLKRPPHPGRAAVVVPNGTLFGDGVCARIKEDLLTGFNLHTIVRLPNGVFAPYTSIPTNLLFFDRSGPTREVWYYEHPLPAGRKNYSKTQPVQYEEFAPLLAWWGDRRENERAWRAPAEQIAANGYNLDLKNPNAAADLEHLPPEQLAASILAKERRIAEIMEEITALLRERS